MWQIRNLSIDMQIKQGETGYPKVLGVSLNNFSSTIDIMYYSNTAELARCFGTQI